MNEDVLERAAAEAGPVYLQKYSSATYPPDAKGDEMPEEMRDRLDRKTIGKVWRARIGKGRRWWYGWSAREALEKALGGDL